MELPTLIVMLSPKCISIMLNCNIYILQGLEQHVQRGFFVERFLKNCDQWHYCDLLLMWGTVYGQSASAKNGKRHLFLRFSLVLVVFHIMLHTLELCWQLPFLAADIFNLIPQAIQELLELGIQIHSWAKALWLSLEDLPFGLQYLVLLLQKANLLKEITWGSCHHNTLG